MDKKIVELMSVPQVDHDLSWLQESLQAAIKLEFATIPPYLSALWSIKGSGPVTTSIRAVVREEMLHLALACNMLSAIGGTPKFNVREFVPAYPDELPGGVHPGLVVPLQKLSKDAIQLFMEIELPQHGPIAMAMTGEHFPTIGEFYSAIENAFQTLQPHLSVDRQIEGPLGLPKLTSINEVQDAIQRIKHQGEGSTTSPEDTGPNDLAHYYRFKEILRERKLRQDPTTHEWHFDGDPLPMPATWPMAKVPEGGYSKADVSDEALWNLIESFDRSFTEMLNFLQDAWQNALQASLESAVDVMIDLSGIGREIVQKEISPALGNYGPCFRLQ